MDVETGPMRSLLSKLEQLLDDEYNLQKGVRRQVRFLRAELWDNYAFLRKIAEEPPEMVDEQARIWARREMREESYDIEDVIDTNLLSVHACSEPTDVGRSRLNTVKRAMKKMGMLPGKAMARGDIAASLEQLQKKLLKVTELYLYLSRRFNRGMQMPVAAASSSVDPRLPALYRNERELVGIEEAREDLIRLLTQGDAEDDKKQGLNVVSIIGLGGVGKTTLAKAVYNRLQEQFDCSAFVSVSRDPDLKKVFMDILLELDEPKYHTGITTKEMDDERQFVEEIRGFLENKRYLIVVDDIWDRHAWNKIRLAIDNNHPGSRIITTTRNSDIIAAAMVAAAEYIYRLKPLSRPNSEKLFYKRIFGGEGNYPDIKLAQVSDKILKECSGLPLAIITVASVLASKPPEEWAEVYNSIALRHKSNRYVHNMRTVLSFSFYDLPPHLRASLFYLSIFPENCFNEKDFLIWKWVAEDFVHERTGTSLFHIGETYFYELVNRSMIHIPDECLHKGRVYGCCVHPVLFSQIRAISSEENFCTVLEDKHHISPGKSNPRRIGMHSIRNVKHNNIAAEANISIKKVRSFNASLCFIDQIPQLSSFQVLRVLALEYCLGMNTDHLKMIGKLVHLRYLGLVGAGVLELPEETLGGLRLLQTLDLRETDIEQWPSTISNLQRLMCLCVHRTRAMAEGMVGTLGSLQYLRLQLVSGDTSKLIAELGRLKRLRVLVLGLEKMDVELERALLDSLRRLPSIQRLEIYCELMAAASDDQEPHITTVVGSSDHAFESLNFFSTNMAVRFESGIGGPPMPNLEHVELHVRVAQCAESWLSSLGLANLKSLEKVTVALDGRGAPTAETEEAEEKLRRATIVHPIRRIRLEVTKQNGNDKVPPIEQFRFKDPRFEDLRYKMEKMQANRQVQPDNDSDEEITPAYAASEY